MQVSTLSTHLKLGSKLIHWYRDATSVPYSHLLIDLSHSQTIHYVIVQTLDPIPQNFIYRSGRNSQKVWTMNTHFFSNLQVFQSFSHKCKSLFLQSCPKEFIRFLRECIKNFLTGNLQNVANFRSKVRLLSLKLTTGKQRRDILASEKD